MLNLCWIDRVVSIIHILTYQSFRNIYNLYPVLRKTRHHVSLINYFSLMALKLHEAESYSKLSTTCYECSLSKAVNLNFNGPIKLENTLRDTCTNASREKTL